MRCPDPRPRPSRPPRSVRRPWRLVATAALAAMLAAPAVARPPWPVPGQAEAVLAGLPAGELARRGVEAEQAVRRQLEAGPHEWTVGAGLARRQLSPLAGRRSTDATIALERGWRSPDKVMAAQRLGAARVAVAEAAHARAWRDQAQSLLDRLATWRREQVQARHRLRQEELAARESAALQRRHALGDASALDRRQAEAAAAQARAQALAARGRLAAAEAALRQAAPGLLPEAGGPPPADPPEAVVPADLAGWRQALREADPGLLQRRRECAALAAELDSLRLERRPDPVLGVHLDRATQDRERGLGLSLSLPLGGAARDAAVQAAAARLAGAEAGLRQAELELEARSAARLEEARAAHGAWQAAAEAAARLDEAAEGVARGQRLGERSLAEALAARRLAQEQALAAELAAFEAWQLRWQLELDAGQLWPLPAPALR